MEKILNITNMCAGYQLGLDVIRNISFSLEKGETFAILGNNGCGESTLAKAIVGLTHFRSGSIIYFGKSIEQLPIDSLQSLGISMMLQGGQVFPNLSVWENLQLASRHLEDKEIFRSVMDTIPLLRNSKKSHLNKSADKLSGGERHQLALAMTLLSGRDLAILDEPTAGLTPSATNALYETLKNVRDAFGTSFLIIEHNAQVGTFASKYGFMDRGELVYQGNDLDIVKELMYK